MIREIKIYLDFLADNKLDIDENLIITEATKCLPLIDLKTQAKGKLVLPRTQSHRIRLIYLVYAKLSKSYENLYQAHERYRQRLNEEEKYSHIDYPRLKADGYSGIYYFTKLDRYRYRRLERI